MKRSPLLIGLSMLSIGLTTGWVQAQSNQMEVLDNIKTYDFAKQQDKSARLMREPRKAKVTVAAELHDVIETCVDNAIGKTGSIDEAAAALVQAEIAYFADLPNLVNTKEKLVEGAYHRLEKDRSAIKIDLDDFCDGSTFGRCSEASKLRESRLLAYNGMSGKCKEFTPRLTFHQKAMYLENNVI